MSKKGQYNNISIIRFIPKGTDLNKITSSKLEQILKKINGKPKAILNYETADELFEEEIRKTFA